MNTPRTAQPAPLTQEISIDPHTMARILTMLPDTEVIEDATLAAEVAALPFIGTTHHHVTRTTHRVFAGVLIPIEHTLIVNHAAWLALYDR